MDTHEKLKEIRSEYKQYLTEKHPEWSESTVSTHVSDACYIWNNTVIVHESGQVVAVRSAGFEHIVALSLIGALHQNAPLQGPIVMDSPFGRLDSVHEKNIISYLPQLANQVMLFVFDKEINEQNTRLLLGGDLLQEYELCRGESFETIIRRK